MRTNIDIDDDLLADAMRESGAKTKKAVVEAGLRLILRLEAQAEVLKFRGKVEFVGDLESSRLSRTFDRRVDDKGGLPRKTKR